MSIVQFTASKTETVAISQIADRVEALQRLRKFPADVWDSRTSLMMDIEACHCNGNPLDLAKLLTFPAFDLKHDLLGIARHLDRETGALRDHFSPRASDRRKWCYCWHDEDRSHGPYDSREEVIAALLATKRTGDASIGRWSYPAFAACLDLRPDELFEQAEEDGDLWWAEDSVFELRSPGAEDAQAALQELIYEWGALYVKTLTPEITDSTTVTFNEDGTCTDPK